MSTQGIPGKSCRLFINAVPLHGTTASPAFDIDLDETSSFESGGAREYTPQLYGGTVPVELIARTDEEIHSAAIGILIGALLPMQVQVGTAGFNYAGNIIIENFTANVTIKASVKYNITCRMTGTWAFPGAGT